MDFDSLFNYCVELNNSTSEKCLVCHIPIESNDEHLKLACNHIFHKTCIGYTNGSINCLYCEKKSIPEIINKQSWQNGKNKIGQTQITCKVVLKTGPNAGQYCNRTECKYHKLQTVSVIVIDPIDNKKINKCNIILKTGKKSGEICCRELPCKYHKEKIQKFNNVPDNFNTDANTNANIDDNLDSDSDLIEV
jgi:hypothetical protein